MRSIVSVCAAALLLWLAPAPANAQPYTSLTREFARFADDTAALPEEERVAQFRQRFSTLFPGFYVPRGGQTDERYEQRIAAALAAFPGIRARYEATEREFAAAYAAGITHFRRYFPDFEVDVPVYLLHSLGEMDGGTRTIQGRTNLVFGADVIARIHTIDAIGPFLDHELFHVEHGKHFDDCEPLWCSLWGEGLATYAASVMNPGATDEQLMLHLPAPIRPAVDADWRGALCLTRAKLTSSESDDYRTFFLGGEGERPYPARFGYYVGYRLAQRIGQGRDLAALTRMNGPAVEQLLRTTLDTMIAEAGGCA